MRQVPTDLRHAARRVMATPLLSFGAMLILALGIGSAAVMADVLDRILLRVPAGVSEPDAIARIYIGVGESYADRTDYETLGALAGLRDELEIASAYLEESLSLGRGRQARRIGTVAHTPRYFEVLGMQPALGAWPGSKAPQEDLAVISYALWQQGFGGSNDVLGKPIHLGTDTYSIAAVAPRGFRGIDKPTDVWLPLVPRARAQFGADWKEQPFLLRVIARLRPGVNRTRANEHATAVYRGTHTQPWETGRVVLLGDLRPGRAPGSPVGTRVEVLVAAVSTLVLIIKCGNVANLLLVRGLRRDREFVVKTALGASRPRLLWEVLLEAFLISAGAGVLALIVVVAGAAMIRQLFLSPLAALASPIDTRVVFVTAAFSVVSAFLLGLVPALRLTMRRALNPGQSALLRASTVLDVFAGLQVALSLPLIVGAGLFVLSLWNACHQDLGMQTDHVAVVTTDLYELGRPFDNHDAHRRMQARIGLLPQVESTALTESMPMASAVFMPIEVPGRDAPKGPLTSDNGNMPAFNSVDPSFFTVMRMRLVDGRFFTEAENRKEARPVAVITESMARIFWSGERAVGKCFYVNGRVEGQPCTEVVGVLADARLFPSIRPTERWACACYRPIEQGYGRSSRALLVRTTGAPQTLIETLRRESQSVAANLPYVDAHEFDDIFTNLMRPWRLGSIVFVIFGAISMIVAAAGLAVLGAYGVTRRVREIGIRSALGARPAQLVGLMLSRSLLVVAIALTAGTGLAWVGGRILSAQLFDVTPGDPRVFAGAVLGLLVVAGAAAWIPARRAARIDPVIALRAE